MPRVFITQIPVKNGKPMDLSKANIFGELLEPCFGPITDVTKNNKEIESKIKSYFEENEIDNEDYILQVGEHTLFTKACIVSTEYVDVVNILKWNREILKGKKISGDYCCVSTDVPFDDY